MTTPPRTYTSPRGMPLVYNGEPGKQPILTAECYMKWYELFLVNPDGSVTSGGFPDDDLDTDYGTLGPAYCDHAPSPTAVCKMAKRLGYHLDREAYEMILGRWLLEYADETIGAPFVAALGEVL